MPVSINKPIVSRMTPTQGVNIWKRIHSYECGYYSTWKAECQSNRAFYYGDQITPEEMKQLEERGQYAISMNKIRKSIRNIVGMLSSSLPQYSIVPMSSNDLHTATIGNRAIKWAWKNSSGVSTFKKWIKDAAVDNISYLFVYVDHRNRVLFKPLSYAEVIPDPSSSDPYFQDATGLIIKRAITLDNAKTFYNIPDTIEMTYESAITGAIDPNASQFKNFLDSIISSDQQYIIVYEIYEKVFERSPDERLSVRIQRKTVLGMNYVVVETLPPSITEYPIIPLYVDKGATPYSKGEVFFVKEIQRFINKCLGVTILNAQLMSSPKAVVHEHDIPNNDAKAFAQNFSKPGSVSVIADGAEFPLIISGQPLNSAFFTMYQDAKMELEAATIPNQMNQDSDVGKVTDMFTHNQILLDGFKDFMSNIEGSCSQLGLVVLQYCRGYLDNGQILRIIGEDDIKVNNSQQLNFDDEKSVQQWIQYQKQIGRDEYEITEELAQLKKNSDTRDAVTYFTNNLDFDDYDIAVIPGSYTPSYEFAMLKIMLELQMRGIVDPSVVLEYLPVENREALIERFDTVQRLTMQLQNATEEAEKYKGMLQKQVDKSISDQIGLQTERHEMRTQNIEKDQRLKLLLIRGIEKLNTKEAKQDHKAILQQLATDIERLYNKIDLEAHKKILAMGTNEPIDVEEIMNEIGDYNG